MFKKLDIYLLKNFLGLFLATFFIAIFILLMQFVWMHVKDLVGKGVEISSFGALDTILTTGIADAWMYWGYEDALARGAKGYFVERGSSYPCDECDSHCGVFHYITDEDNRPQFHAHCCCYIVYSYTERL